MSTTPAVLTQRQLQRILNTTLTAWGFLPRPHDGSPSSAVAGFLMVSY